MTIVVLFYSHTLPSSSDLWFSHSHPAAGPPFPALPQILGLFRVVRIGVAADLDVPFDPQRRQPLPFDELACSVAPRHAGRVPPAARREILRLVLAEVFAFVSPPDPTPYPR